MALRRTIEAELTANGDNKISEEYNRPRDDLQMSTCDGVGTFDCSSTEMSESESRQGPESIRSPSNDPSCLPPTASMVSLQLFPSSEPEIPDYLEESSMATPHHNRVEPLNVRDLPRAAGTRLHMNRLRNGHDDSTNDYGDVIPANAGEAPPSSPAESDTPSLSQLVRGHAPGIGVELDSSLAKEFPSSSALDQELKEDQIVPCKGAGVRFTKEADPVIKRSKRRIESSQKAGPGEARSCKRRRKRYSPGLSESTGVGAVDEHVAPSMASDSWLSSATRAILD